MFVISITKPFCMDCEATVIFVLLSPLVPVITRMATISYNPLANSIGNYLFIMLFHCAFPAFLFFICRIINMIQKNKDSKMFYLFSLKIIACYEI